MLRLLIINLLLSLFWPVLNDDFSLRGLFLGFGLGFIILALLDRRYGRFARQLASFIVYVLYQILVSNVQLAWLIIRITLNPTTVIRPGIVSIPLAIQAAIDKTTLASIITLTPGTVSVDLGRNAAGEEVLYVHAIDIADPEAFRQEIKAKFEQRLLQLREDLDDDE